MFLIDTAYTAMYKTVLQDGSVYGCVWFNDISEKPLLECDMYVWSL